MIYGRAMIARTLVVSLLLGLGACALTDDHAMDPADPTSLPTQVVEYSIGETRFESTIVHHGDHMPPRPGILMVPNWLGPTAASLEKAKAVAANGYVVMMVDMYGTDVRPTNAGEASAAAGAVRGDRAMMRARASKALSMFREAGAELGLDPGRVAAIGFCFGGGTVLELGRSGADLAAIVSFHGDLMSPTLANDAGKTKARVLVCHGADDPYVPQQDVEQWIKVYAKTRVDWQLLQFGGTVHSFTDPAAASEGARFHQRSNDRAFAAMRFLLDSIWRG